MDIEQFLDKVANETNTITFEETMNVIDDFYDFSPVAFQNGKAHNDAGQNNGSCKIFAFAQLHSLSQSQTLGLFGRFYREDVLQNPLGDDHQNIRNFIEHGWDGVIFSQPALVLSTRKK